MYRGIENVSHVSCHLACAVQILVHAISPVRRTLQSLRLSKGASGAVDDHEDRQKVIVSTSYTTHDELANMSMSPIILEFLDFVGTNDSVHKQSNTNAWAPRKLYRYLQEADSTIDPYGVGDSSSSLSKILHIVSDISPDWGKLLTMSVWEGTTRQILVGTKQCVQREKRQSKCKRMACPFVIKIHPPLSGSELVTATKQTIRLQDCIDGMVEPHIVQGEYPWDNQLPESFVERQIDCTVEDVAKSNDDSSESWKTTKQVQFEDVPRVWLLHIERPNWRQVDYDSKNGTMTNLKDLVPTVDVPLQLDLTNVLRHRAVENTNKSVTLQGAIVQVRYVDEDNHQTTNGDVDDHNYDEGHCFTILRNTHDESGTTQKWTKLDDENVIPLDEQQALEMIRGCIAVTVKGARTCMFASLLVYSPDDEHFDDWTQCINSISKSWTEALVTRQIDGSKKIDLVGRRLQVKWAKGKYYKGTVTAYDERTGTHKITYDDGDVRSYFLEKKTIIWLDDDDD